MKFPKLSDLKNLFSFWPFSKKKDTLSRKYGWKPDLPDHRDFLFQIKRPIDLPEKVDLRTKDITVFDQGDLGSCFHPDTKIPLLNGKEYTIKELADGVEGEYFWVYSIDKNNKMVPGKATAQLTGINKELISITLDNNEKIICTPDHKFLKRDGEYIEAQYLKENDSLMPLYRKKSDKGYELVFGNNDIKYHYTHWNVGSKIYENEIKYIKKEIKKSVVLHHVNFKKEDNSPENLLPMTWMDHTMLHAKLSENSFKNWNGSEKQKEHSKKLCKKMHEENPGWNLEGCSKGGKKAQEKINQNEELLEIRNKNLEIGRKDPNVREKAKNSIKKAWNFDEKKKEQSIKSKNNWLKIKSNFELNDKFKKIGIDLGKNSGKNKIIIWAKEILDTYGEINENIWNEKKKNEIHNFAKYQSIFKYFKNIDELKEVASNYNHKVKKIENLNFKSDVYCLTVEEYENFALSAGVYVHNCTANAISAAYSYNMRLQVEDEIFIPSRLFIYYNEREMENSIAYDSGAMIRDGIKTINKTGVCDEKIWPYDISKFAVKPLSECYEQAGRNKAVKYERLNNSKNELKTCLALGFPFVFGFTVYESFETRTVAKTGKMPMPEKKEKSLGGHAVMGIGYDDSIECFIVRNSWGTGWGDKGYFYMPYDFITDSDFCADFWVVQKVS